MGYAVYEEPGTDRWAGYSVPAECDWPGCAERIDRGLGYRCEDHAGDEIPENIELVAVDPKPTEGCGLFFCEQHRYQTEEHEDIAPKPDSDEWIAFQLTDASWATWRAENAEHVAQLHERMRGSRQHVALVWPPNGVTLTGRWRDIAPVPALLIADGWRRLDPELDEHPAAALEVSHP